MAKVIAFATNKQAYFDLFLESCRCYNINPIILGWGERWIGFGKKTTDIRNYIKRFPKDEIIISVDPFDVIFLCGLDEIEKKFNECSSGYICGALKLRTFLGHFYNSEFNKTGKPMPQTKFGYNYPNTGTWIARAGYAIDLIDKLTCVYHMKDTDMDQEKITGIYVEDNSIAGIDWKCKIFHNLLFKDFITRESDLKDIEFTDGRIYNTATDTYPCILHASGNALMNKIATNLCYEKKFSMPVNNNSNFFRKALFHIHQLIKK